MTATIPLSVLIITYNEELHIENCIRNVQGWASQIFVVDSFSTDRTVEIAKSMGATVVSHEFKYPAQQKNWALQNLHFEHEWLLLLDADERVPTVLRDEITKVVAENSRQCDGYWMRYRLIFYDRWIRHCGWYPTWCLRLVRRSKTRFEDRQVDEHAIVAGSMGYLQNDLLHQSLHDMTAWIAKHNRYSSQNAKIYFDLLQEKGSADLVPPRIFGTQAERKRFIKERIWPHLPGRAILLFAYMYIFRLGFLDGRQGFIFCYMHAIFQQFNIVKLWELQRTATQREDQDEKGAELLRSVYRSFSASPNPAVSAHLFRAVVGDKTAGCALILRVGDIAHYNWGAFDYELRNSRVNEGLQWAIIERLRAMNVGYYDLEGADLKRNPGVFHFKRKMGGHLIEHPRYQLSISL